MFHSQNQLNPDQSMVVPSVHVVAETKSTQMCPSCSDLPDIVMIVVSIPLSIYTAVSVILFYLFDC